MSQDNGKYELTPEQITWIRENFKKSMSLREIVTGALGYEEDGSEIDVRSIKGRAVREFLASENKQYLTARSRKSDLIKLTDEQIEVINELSSRGRPTLEIAQSVFNKNVIQLSAEHRVVMDYIKDNTDVSQNSKDIELSFDRPNRVNKYQAPQQLSMVISKINKATDANWDESKMNRMEMLCAEKLKNRLNNSRFKIIYSSFPDKEDALLFEQEFIRFTYDKADLNQEEIYQYMELVRDSCSLEAQYRHIQILHEEFEASAGSGKQGDMSIRLSTMIKEKEDALNKTKVRVKNAINSLQGDRKERINKQNQNSANFLAIVKAFQEEEERELMVKMAELQRKSVEDEATRLENMEEFKARILGLHKETLV